MARPLRIMFHNPVGCDTYDNLFAEVLAQNAAPGTEVHVTSLPPADGAFTHIEYRAYEGRVMAGILRATRAAAREGFDAFVIGCFYDTALHEARELSGQMAVTGPCIASCEIATSLANRFGVIVGRRKWVGQMQGTVHAYGYGDRLAGFYHVELGVTEFQADHAETERRLLDAGRRAVDEDYAEALILGCTLEIGFHKKLEDVLGVPVIDPSLAAFKRAEYAATLRRDCGWVPSRKWSCEAPPEEEMAAIGGFDVNAPFGNRIVVAA
ncbi:MAG: aspartate/glutamate racemase family protein [Pseudomonadota bacterium]